MTPEAGRPIQPDRGETLLSRLISDYGILLALLLLCIYFSISTVSVEALSGRDGGRILGVSVRSRFTDREVLVAVVAVICGYIIARYARFALLGGVPFERLSVISLILPLALASFIAVVRLR